MCQKMSVIVGTSTLHFYTPKHDVEQNKLRLVALHVGQTASWVPISCHSPIHEWQSLPQNLQMKSKAGWIAWLLAFLRSCFASDCCLMVS